jgi:hypothetical protein
MPPHLDWEKTIVAALSRRYIIRAGFSRPAVAALAPSGCNSRLALSYYPNEGATRRIGG